MNNSVSNNAQSTNAFESLLPEEHNVVLEFVSLTNMEDLNEAAIFLKNHNFDLHEATQAWFTQFNNNTQPKNNKKLNSPPPELNYFSHEHLPVYNDDHHADDYHEPMDIEQTNPIQPLLTGIRQDNSNGIGTQLPNNTKEEKKIPDDQDLHALYRTHVEKQNQAKAQKTNPSEFLAKGSNDIFGKNYSWNNSGKPSTKGEKPLGEEFINQMYKNNPNFLKNSIFSRGSFEENLIKAHEQKKPLIVYLYSNDDALSNDFFLMFLHDKGIKETIQKNFVLLGLIKEYQDQELIAKYVDLKKGSQLAIFRINLLDEIQLAKIIELDQHTQSGSILEQLRDEHSNFIFFLTEETKIKNDVNNKLKREKEQANRRDNQAYGYPNYYNSITNRLIERPVIDPNTQLKLEEDRILRKIQEEEYKEVERKILIQKEKQIQDQKEQELKNEEKRKRKLTEELEKQKKKENLPVEPKEDDSDVINIIFRLPNGDRIPRRFQNYLPVSVLYDFVDTLDIKFENSESKYDLIQALPFMCLEDRNKSINDYFNDSSDEILQIRERA